MQPRIAVVGSANSDVIVQVRRLPAPGETVLGSNSTLADGGKGANQAVGAQRLGAQVTFVAAVGSDVFGRQAVRAYRQAGLNLRFLRRHPESPSGLALILVGAEGENVIAVAPGANALLTPADVDAAAGAIGRSHMLLVQLEIPLDTVKRALQVARAAGVKTLLNPAPACPPDIAPDLIRLSDIINPNQSEAERLSGHRTDDIGSAIEAAQILRRAGAGAVVITMGGAGAVVVDSDHAEHIPAYPIEPIDSTAAGDAFTAALGVALARGATLPEAARYASAAGALACTRLGAQPSLPTHDEVMTLIKQGHVAV